MKPSRLLLLLLVALAGCAARANQHQLTRRAAFDLGCTADQIEVTEIDERTRGVRGCGQQATYVESCDGPVNNSNTTCTWVINGATTPVR